MINHQFLELSQRVSEINIQILNLHKYTSGQFPDVYKEFGKTRDDIQRVYELVDADLKQQEIDDHERLAMNHQLDRHENWIEKAAERIGYKPEATA